MKKVTMFLSILYSFCLIAENVQNYMITGTLPDSVNNTFVLLSKIYPENDTGNSVLDSSMVLDGKFRFEGQVHALEKNVYKLWSEAYPNINGMLVLESGCIDIRMDNDTIIGGQIMLYATGTPLNDQLTDSIFTPSYEITKQMSALWGVNAFELTTEQKEVFNRNRDLARTMYFNLVSFVKNNSNNAAGEYMFLLMGKAIREKEMNEILPLLSAEMQQKYNESKITKDLVGHAYIPFSCKAQSSETFNLSDIIGQRKLILLDFWASWCGPCIKEMPVLVELYKKYKDKGLEIISISTDNDELQWKKAIEKHNMTWLQLINGKEKNSNAKEMYGVQYIPYTVLIDSNGKIINTNLRGKDLIQQIQNILD